MFCNSLEKLCEEIKKNGKKTWRAESKSFAFTASEFEWKPGIMMYEMNSSEKEHSLIRTTENLLCCVFVPILFLLDQGDEGCRSFQMQSLI